MVRTTILISNMICILIYGLLQRRGAPLALSWGTVGARGVIAGAEALIPGQGLVNWKIFVRAVRENDTKHICQPTYFHCIKIKYPHIRSYMTVRDVRLHSLSTRSFQMPESLPAVVPVRIDKVSRAWR